MHRLECCSSRALRRFFAVMLLAAFGASAHAADTAAEEHPTSRALRRIEKKYNDIRQDLREEYAALAKEREENSNDIFERVQELEESRRSLSSRETAGTDGTAAAADPRARMDRLYNNALASLQRLYQLNGKRYNDLAAVHAAKESLADTRYREERELAAERARIDARQNRRDIPEAHIRRWDTRLNAVDSRMTEAENSYRSTLAALDDYADLIESRIASQKSYLRSIGSLADDMKDSDLSAESLDRLEKRLADLSAEKNAEERRYRNDVRFIEEKLALENQKNRDLARISEERARIAGRWAAGEGRLARRNRDAAADLTPAEREAFEERRIMAMNAYDNASAALDQRQQLLYRIYSDRMDYLEKRNDIRVKMSRNAMDENALEKYRQEIAELEESRMRRERETRDEMMALSRTIPVAYAVTQWDGRDEMDRRQLAMRRIDRSQERLTNRMQNALSRFEENQKEINQRLADTSLSEQDRRMYEEMNRQLSARQQKRQESYEEALKKLEERRQLENTRLQAREAYLQKRNQLTAGVSGTGPEYADVNTYEQEIRNLDAEWEKSEREYREKSRTIARALPVGESDGAWREQNLADWNRGLERARAGEFDTDRGFVESVRESVHRAGEAIAEKYHEAVDYLTD